MAALSCGTEAEMFGSLMMFASGLRRQRAEFGEGVADLLVFGEEIPEIGE